MERTSRSLRDQCVHTARNRVGGLVVGNREPLNAGAWPLVPPPGLLALGVAARGALRLGDGVRELELTVEMGGSLRIAKACEAGRVARHAAREKRARLVEEPGGEEGARGAVEPR